MSDFNKDDYLAGMADMESLKAQTPESDSSGPLAADSSTAPAPDSQVPVNQGSTDAGSDSAADSSAADDSAVAEAADTASAESATTAPADELTPLGKAKKEAADYLEALQRERAEFINFRNRATKEQTRFREHGVIDVLTALLPALDDLDRAAEHGELPDPMKAVQAKIDKAFATFKVEKFGQKGEDFDPTKHDAVLHKPDAEATKEVVDTVVESGYRIGDRVIRAARVVVASPQAN